VADLKARWNETKHRASPHCSPNNSDDEEEEDVNDEEGGEMGTAGLVFGHDKSEDESDINNIVTYIHPQNCHGWLQYRLGRWNVGS
jgi:hypothetical protein